MSLPDWNDHGLLPPGRHHATLEDVHERCVLDAPNTSHRQELFGSLITYTRLVQRVVGPATLWIDGGFVTAKRSVPFDVDVLIRPKDWTKLSSQPAGRERDRLYGLLTLQDVIVGTPLYVALERIQPLAGDLDSFLCFPGQEDVWHDTWSSVKDDDGDIIEGAIKGYVEVIV
ncbi:DUF6932 family protein [Gordonia alkaliphila]|uniref:Uncharacterized protein n=1 Tax=Gordonia alkaliphila TaxID=1053547 RepID=A0ABP8ZGI8_9ACTN